MKAQNTYTITAKEESQINNILDEGLDELIGQDGMIKHNEPRYQAISPQVFNQYMYRYDHNNVDDLVNKCNNKRFMNRYEHYKTIYFQKMDEKFQKKQRQRELDTSTSREHVDLNKTT